MSFTVLALLYTDRSLRVLFLSPARYPLKPYKTLNLSIVSDSSHHLRAYLVFLLISLLLIGLLAYLYLPFNIGTSYLHSDILTMSSEESISAEVIVTQDNSDTVAAKRIRFTNLLLRYQRELAELESSHNSSSTQTREAINALRVKIENLEKFIAELSQ